MTMSQGTKQVSTHLHERDRTPDVHAVVRQRDLSALANGLERGEVDDSPDTPLGGELVEHLVDRGGFAEVDLTEEGLRGVGSA